METSSTSYGPPDTPAASLTAQSPLPQFLLAQRATGMGNVFDNVPGVGYGSPAAASLGATPSVPGTEPAGSPGGLAGLPAAAAGGVGALPAAAVSRMAMAAPPTEPAVLVFSQWPAALGGVWGMEFTPITAPRTPLAAGNAPGTSNFVSAQMHRADGVFTARLVAPAYPVTDSPVIEHGPVKGVSATAPGAAGETGGTGSAGATGSGSVAPSGHVGGGVGLAPAGLTLPGRHLTAGANTGNSSFQFTPEEIRRHQLFEKQHAQSAVPLNPRDQLKATLRQIIQKYTAPLNATDRAQFLEGFAEGFKAGFNGTLDFIKSLPSMAAKTPIAAWSLGYDATRWALGVVGGVIGDVFGGWWYSTKPVEAQAVRQRVLDEIRRAGHHGGKCRQCRCGPEGDGVRGAQEH